MFCLNPKVWVTLLLLEALFEQNPVQCPSSLVETHCHNVLHHHHCHSSCMVTKVELGPSLEQSSYALANP